MPSDCARHIKTLICMPDDVLEAICHKAKLDPRTPQAQLKPLLLAAFGVDSEASLFELTAISNLVPAPHRIVDDCYKIQGFHEPIPLTNSHIDKTLDQWELNFGDFCNVGFTMLNFSTYHGLPQQLIEALPLLLAGKPVTFKHADVGGELRQKGPPPRRRFSIVVNSDKLGGAGKHWTCLFIDLTKPAATIEFFNSSGNPPYPEILDWVELFRAAAMSLPSHPCTSIQFVPVTSIRHQKGGTECGVYCLNYIDQRLQGISSDHFKHVEVPDEKMTAFRTKVFRS